MRGQLKLLLTTKKGWLSWFIANIITSLHWAIPFFIGWIFDNQNLMIFAGSLWALGLSPFIPLFVINIALAFWINNLLRKLK
jgi:hypothetical protein